MNLWFFLENLSKYVEWLLLNKAGIAEMNASIMTTDHYISNQEILVYGRSVVFSEYSSFYFYFIRGHLIEESANY